MIFISIGSTKKTGCTDDPNWKDSKYGDGTSKCTDMQIDWCKPTDDYSTEAKNFCPLSCGLCSGVPLVREFENLGNGNCRYGSGQKQHFESITVGSLLLCQNTCKPT